MRKGFADLMQGVNEIINNTSSIVVVSALLLIRSEFKDNEMKKEKKKNKAESDAEKAKAAAKADRYFLITTSMSAGALLVSIVVTLTTKKY